MRTNLSNLLNASQANPGKDIHASSWCANTGPSGDTDVWHYATLMVTFSRENDGSLDACPVSPGWGSMSDKQGIGKILRGSSVQVFRAGVPVYNYNCLFG